MNLANYFARPRPGHQKLLPCRSTFLAADVSSEETMGGGVLAPLYGSRFDCQGLVTTRGTLTTP